MRTRLAVASFGLVVSPRKVIGPARVMFSCSVYVPAFIRIVCGVVLFGRAFIADWIVL
jgi:hypothetical protein